MKYTNEILQHIQENYPQDILNIYVYGSFCYGTENQDSDIDLIALVDDITIANQEVVKEFLLSDNRLVHCRYMHLQEYIDTLNSFTDHVILESFYSPIKLKESYKIDFCITEKDFPLLRRIISHTSSNSFCKAFKKIKQGDEYVGLKSLLHSLRTPVLFLQIAQNKIPNFRLGFEQKSAKELYDEIVQDFYLLQDIVFKEKYKLMRNKVMTDFRKVVGKD